MKYLKLRTRGYNRSSAGFAEQGILKQKEMIDMVCAKPCCKSGYRCEFCGENELKYSRLQHANAELKLSLAELKLKVLMDRSKGKKSEVDKIMKDLPKSDGMEGTSTGVSGAGNSKIVEKGLIQLDVI